MNPYSDLPLTFGEPIEEIPEPESEPPPLTYWIQATFRGVQKFYVHSEQERGGVGSQEFLQFAKLLAERMKPPLYCCNGGAKVVGDITIEMSDGRVFTIEGETEGESEDCSSL